MDQNLNPIKDQSPNLKKDERLDDLQCRGYRIIQNGKRFCFGMDAVLLSAFARVNRDETVLDIGTGTGIVPILLEAKTYGSHFTGLEISEASADMACRSVLLNGLSEKITIVQGDMREAGKYFAPASFDVITSNPPYMTGNHGLVNPDPEKAAARHELTCTFDDVASCAARFVKPGGRFNLVHRPFRLAEIIRTLSEHRLEPKRMRFVYPYLDQEPNMVLIESIRGGRPRVTVEKPLIVYEKPGVYTREVLELYRYQREET